MCFLIFFEFFNHLLAFSLIIILSDPGRKKVAKFFAFSSDKTFVIWPKFRQFEIRVKEKDQYLRSQNLAMFRPPDFIWIPPSPLINLLGFEWFSLVSTLAPININFCQILSVCGFCPFAAFVRLRLRLLSVCGFCPFAAFVRLRLLSVCGFCPFAAFVRLRLLSVCGFCPFAAFVRLRLLSVCGFCPFAGLLSYTPCSYLFSR